MCPEEMPRVRDEASRTARRLAIVAFFPDWGHIQPLMRIAAAAQSAGIEVMCFVPEQARPLVEQQRLRAEYFPNASTSEIMATFRRLGRATTFFREFSGHAHHDLLIVPETIATIGGALPGFAERIRNYGPLMIVSDAAVFGAYYQRIAQSLGIPIAKSHPSYGLAALHRKYVQTYGLSDVSHAYMRAVEWAGTAFQYVYRRGYYAAHLARYLRLRRLKRFFEAQFATYFPTNGRPIQVTEVMSSIGWVERHLLRPDVKLPEGFVTFPPRRLFSEALSDDVGQWLASSAQKVIYVSFGSMVSLGARHREKLFHALVRTQRRVLWSAPSEECEHLKTMAAGNPAVFVTSYVAQAALLRRSELACFITHGGASGAMEGWAGGTPMICVPFFTDQPYIGSIIEETGTGLRAWKKEIGTPVFVGKLQRVLAGDFDARAAEVAKELARYEQAHELEQFLVDTINAGVLTSQRNRE